MSSFKVGVRQRIRKLFHHSSRRSKKADAESTTSFTESSPRVTGSVQPNILTIGRPYEQSSDYTTISQPLHLAHPASRRRQSEGAPLGVGLDDALYPPTIHSSTVPTPEPSEYDFDTLGDLGPPPAAKASLQDADDLLAHPGSEIPATPIGEDASVTWHSDTLPVHRKSEQEDYFGEYTLTQGNGASTREIHKMNEDIPPECINVLPEPPKLIRLVSCTDRAALARESAWLTLRTQGQGLLTPGGLNIERSSSIPENYRKSHPSSVDSGSVYSGQSISEPIGGRRGPPIRNSSHYMEEVTQSVLSRSGEESPVLGWPNHRSEYANPINPMMLSASTEDITSKKRETLGSTDSGYAENKNMSNSEHSQTRAGPGPLYRISQSPDSPYGMYLLGGRLPKGREPRSQSASSSQVNERHRYSPFTAPASYSHEAEIYKTHIPSLTSPTDTHISSNPAVIHECISPRNHEIRDAQITREVHSYEVRSSILPIVQPEYLSPKHYVQLESGKKVEISAEEAERMGYPMLMTDNKVVAPRM